MFGLRMITDTLMAHNSLADDPRAARCSIVGLVVTVVSIIVTSTMLDVRVATITGGRGVAMCGRYRSLSRVRH
tara:strand:- start:8443 stop:8661 length:219 start_codon:yes stop_codon:yes gene_type:complete